MKYKTDFPFKISLDNFVGRFFHCIDSQDRSKAAVKFLQRVLPNGDFHVGSSAIFFRNAEVVISKITSSATKFSLEKVQSKIISLKNS